MCSTILHHDIEEIKYHLSEIVSLKEIEIMEARRKAAEREEQEQAKQVAQEEQIKNRHLILKLSKQIRYFAKRGKLGNLTNFLAKFQGRFQGLINNKSSKGCTGKTFKYIFMIFKRFFSIALGCGTWSRRSHQSADQ